MKIARIIFTVLVVLNLFLTSACGQKEPQGEPQPPSSSQPSDEAAKPVIKVTEATVKSGETRSAGAGTAVEQLSFSPLTDSVSFTVKEAVNYKWIAYDNYTLRQRFEDGLKLAKGGYLFYVELPKTAFDHEMYFEFFSEHDKVKEYSGEVAFTESEKLWYSLKTGDSEWSEHTTSKYKLCFSDDGEEYKGYVFIPADSLTYRYESDKLSDVCVYVKTGIETGNGETGEGITFSISTVMPVESFDSSTVIAESSRGRIDLSKNSLAE